jgi:hypothetical protein
VRTLLRSRSTHDVAFRRTYERPIGRALAALRPFPTLGPLPALHVFPTLGGDLIVPPPPVVDGTARTVSPPCQLRTNIVP